MWFALYATIWVALLLFAIAEMGKARAARPPHWALRASMAGAVLAGIHVLLALALRYGWNHEAAVSGTAQQSAQVYGYAWRGSIYVSYVFVLLWVIEAIRWQLNPALFSQRSTLTTWILRVFFLLIIVNGAVIFATYPMRLFGVVIAAGLVWTWMTTASASSQTRESSASQRA